MPTIFPSVRVCVCTRYGAIDLCILPAYFRQISSANQIQTDRAVLYTPKTQPSTKFTETPAYGIQYPVRRAEGLVRMTLLYPPFSSLHLATCTAFASSGNLCLRFCTKTLRKSHPLRSTQYRGPYTRNGIQSIALVVSVCVPCALPNCERAQPHCIPEIDTRRR